MASASLALLAVNSAPRKLPHPVARPLLHHNSTCGNSILPVIHSSNCCSDCQGHQMHNNTLTSSSLASMRSAGYQLGKYLAISATALGSLMSRLVRPCWVSACRICALAAPAAGLMQDLRESGVTQQMCPADLPARRLPTPATTVGAPALQQGSCYTLQEERLSSSRCGMQALKLSQRCLHTA